MEADSDDEFNPTLAAMETEIKPKVLKTINNLTDDLNMNTPKIRIF